MTTLPLTALSKSDLSSLVLELGGRGYQADILHSFVWRQGAGSIEEMSSLSKELRAALAARGRLFSSTILAEHASADGTIKFALGMEGGDEIEAVLIPGAGEGYTACISTQIGCAMGCDFCASTKAGLKRDLTGYEIIEQILHLRRRLPAGESLERVVVMGIGEPLANFANLRYALERLHDPEGINMGARRITVSTVGLPAGIRRFAELPAQYNLAVSLHAPNDELRTRIIPTNKATGIAAILEAADDFFQTTGREYTIEYILLHGVNDSAEQARELGRLLKGRRCVVNLIPMNPISDAAYLAPPPDFVQAFTRILNDDFHIPTHVRQRKGDDIAAACGQLRLNRQTAGR